MTRNKLAHNFLLLKKYFHCINPLTRVPKIRIFYDFGQWHFFHPFLPHFTYTKWILHLVSVKKITFKSFYNWFNIDILRLLRPPTAIFSHVQVTSNITYYKASSNYVQNTFWLPGGNFRCQKKLNKLNGTKKSRNGDKLSPVELIV